MIKAVFVALFTCAATAAAGADGWGRADPRAAQIKIERLRGLADAVVRGEFPKTTSVIVVRNGRLGYEAYFGDGGPDVLNNTRSATKSLTSLAVGMAIADGRIRSAEDPAFAYLSELRPFANDTPVKDQIRISDLLSMSSALACNDDVAASPGNEDRMHEQQNWTRWIVDLPTDPGWRRDASRLGPFRYCTAGAVLLGQIVQRAENEPVDLFIDRRLLAPLGIDRYAWQRSPAGEAMTGGGLGLRSRDLAKLAWIVADQGRWRGRRIVPAAFIEAALTPRRKPDADHDYGWLFWRTDYSTPCGTFSAWYMAGNGGNAISVLPALNAAVVITRTNYGAHGMHEQTADLMRRFVVPALAC